MRGSIKQRSPGSWSIRVYLGPDPQTGKKRYKRVTVQGTKAEAERALLKLIPEAERQKRRPSVARQTVEERLKDWLAAHSIAIEESTKNLYDLAIRAWIGPRIGSIPVARLHASDINRMMTNLKALGYSDRTIQQAYAVLHEGLQATSARAVFEDPELQHPRVRRRQVQPRSVKAIGAFTQTLQGDAWEVPILTALITGMRRGEVLGLKWDALEIDGEAPHVIVFRAVRRTKGGTALVEPKTKESGRYIEIPMELAAILRRHRDDQDDHKGRVGDLFKDEGYVFPGATGRAIYPDSFTGAFDRLARAAGIQDMTLHQLRHAFASLLLSMGYNLKLVQGLLGHASIATTGNIYGHLTPGLGREATNRLGQALLADRVIVKDDQRMTNAENGTKPHRNGKARTVVGTP